MGIFDVLIATGLALISPGAGQIYNGQTKKGFWFFGIGLVLWILSETILTQYWFEIGVLRLFQLWTIIDAIVVSIGIYRGKRELSFVRNWKGVLKIIVVIVVPLCLLFGKAALERMVLINYFERISQPPEDLATVQKEILQHLENKYGQEFEVVEDVEYNPTLNDFSLVARPKENKRVIFTGTKYADGEIHDNYPTALWETQLEEEMSPLMDQMYPPQNRWEVSLDVYESDLLDNQLDLKNIPDYQEIRRQYPDNTWVEMDIFLFKDMNESNKDEELEKFFRLIQFFRENEMKDFSLEILYYDEQLLREKGRDIKVSAEFSDYRRYRIRVTEEEAETLHAPKDLEKYLIVYPK